VDYKQINEPVKPSGVLIIRKRKAEIRRVTTGSGEIALD